MREQRFSHRHQSAAALRAPNSNLAGIQINWVEAVAGTIEIRHDYIEAATKVCGINFKAGYRQGYDAEPALTAEAQPEAQQILVSRPGRRAA
jgi:hypothetical protein